MTDREWALRLLATLILCVVVVFASIYWHQSQPPEHQFTTGPSNTYGPFEAPVLEPNTTYYWTVTAHDANGKPYVENTKTH